MKRALMVASIFTVLAVSAITFEANTARAAYTFQLTVSNVTVKQPITPPVVVIHDANIVLLPSVADRLPGLEAMAESGSQPDLIAALRERRGVKGIKRFGGIIRPGEATTIADIHAEPGDLVSVIGMLACTNDAITVGSVVVTGAGPPAFGSGIVLDVGTEVNDESRNSVPCLEGDGVSALDTHDGEGTIEPHLGIMGNADLGEEFGWDGAVMHLILDDVGHVPPQSEVVSATLHNRTIAQPITPPVVIVHDPNVEPVSYTRPAELDGIDDLAEGGISDDLIVSLSSVPGVVSVSQWDTDGPISPKAGYSHNVVAFNETAITLVGMFACTNDAYIVATANVMILDGVVRETSGATRVFDSGSEDNEETAATVPCLGGEEAALSDGVGENERKEHTGIKGVGDLNPAIYGWRPDTTAELTISAAAEEAVGVIVATQLPRTGGVGPTGQWVLLIGVLGLFVLGTGFGAVLIVPRR